MTARLRARARPGPRPLKVVITGPFGAGKTTLIETLSDVAVVATEAAVTGPEEARKPTTTVAMDFGRLSFGEGTTLFLFGTPGQRRFEVMWEILSEGMIGFILLVNAADARSLEESVYILEQFRRYADVPYLVGVTHLDEVPSDPAGVLGDVRARLELPPGVLVVGCDARSLADAKALMLRILGEVKARLGAAAG